MSKLSYEDVVKIKGPTEPISRGEYNTLCFKIASGFEDIETRIKALEYKLKEVLRACNRISEKKQKVGRKNSVVGGAKKSRARVRFWPTVRVNPDTR